MTALICFTMDNLSDAADLGRGLIDEPRPPGNRPALELGFPAMLELFKRFDVSITHFLEGWNGDAHPDMVRDLVSRGHSIGMHGWQHERWSELDAERELELAVRATDALEKGAGVRPLAFRAPGGRRTANTIRILSELGYTIDASLNESGDEGLGVHHLAGKLWNVPFHREAIDAAYWLWSKRTPAAVEQSWHQLLDKTVRENGFQVFIWHPHIMGMDKGRLAVGEKILERVCGSDDFTVLSLDELAAHYQHLTI